MSTTYNGWSNYETWAANLWLTNDEGLSHELDRIVRQHGKAYERAETLKDWVYEAFVPDLGASLAADLLNAAFGEIDWFEIIENHAEDAEEDEEDE